MCIHVQFKCGNIYALINLSFLYYFFVEKADYKEVKEGETGGKTFDGTTLYAGSKGGAVPALHAKSLAKTETISLPDDFSGRTTLLLIGCRAFVRYPSSFSFYASFYPKRTPTRPTLPPPIPHPSQPLCFKIARKVEFFFIVVCIITTTTSCRRYIAEKVCDSDDTERQHMTHHYDSSL